MRRVVVLIVVAVTCVLSLSLVQDDADYSLDIDPLPREAQELLRELPTKEVVFVKIVTIRILQNETTSKVMDRIRVKYPDMYDKAVEIGQILTRKMDKLTPESRAFVMEVLHKSSVTPSFFAHQSELTNEQTVEVVKKFLKLSEKSRGYIRAYFPRMVSLIWRVVNRYYVRRQEKELRN